MSRISTRTAFVVAAGALLALFGSTAPASASTTTAASTPTTIAKSNVGVTPNITGPVSCIGRDEWVHVYTHDHGDLCYGYIGTAAVTFPNDTYGVCLGNNYATVVGYELGNGDIDVTSVTIRGWSGHSTCVP